MTLSTGQSGAVGDPDCWCFGGCAPARHPTSGPEAREHYGHRRRNSKTARLRARQARDDWRRRRYAEYRGRHPDWHGRIYVPEQASGKRLDADSDIFSFGAVLYEMLSGSRAFEGDSTIQVLSAILSGDPKPLQAPPGLERIVKRCLAKEPGQRFQTVSRLITALDQVAINPSRLEPSIAVLPFANMSADKENEYFSDGLAEEIINALTHIPGLKVTARTSAFAFRGKEQDIGRSEELLQKLLPGEAYAAPLGLAHYYLYCGELDKAMDWSEKAIEQRHPAVLFFLNVHIPVLRSSPRWPDLKRLLNLP